MEELEGLIGRNPAFNMAPLAKEVGAGMEALVELPRRPLSLQRPRPLHARLAGRAQPASARPRTQGSPRKAADKQRASPKWRHAGERQNP